MAHQKTISTTSCIDLHQSLKQIDMIPLICQSYIQYLFLAYNYYIILPVLILAKVLWQNILS